VLPFNLGRPAACFLSDLLFACLALWARMPDDLCFSGGLYFHTFDKGRAAGCHSRASWEVPWYHTYYKRERMIALQYSSLCHQWLSASRPHGRSPSRGPCDDCSHYGTSEALKCGGIRAALRWFLWIPPHVKLHTHRLVSLPHRTWGGQRRESHGNRQR
jgi:hypothetical protein